MSTTIRNFCIIAHIDHGKSTLADRLLELTGTIPKREMREQVLDQMDLERERGITIKLAPVQMRYEVDGQAFTLNLIDTPGHVDFSYEVSRSLTAVEGAILLVDATQGIQAQTVANFRLARAANLRIIPAVNKIDLPNADVDSVSQRLAELVGEPSASVLRLSAKTGEGVTDLIRAIVRSVPPPGGSPSEPLQALVFDSAFDEYRGVIASVRVVTGGIRAGEKIEFFGTSARSTVLEVGVFRPKLAPTEELRAGDIGYVITGLKSVLDCRVGDTMTKADQRAAQPLAGYQPPTPMVFAGLYPHAGQKVGKLREALEKLQLNDASLSFQPERSDALGFGFRCGFLGVLHLDVVQQRLEREFGVRLIVTTPSVAYRVTLNEAGNQALRRREKRASGAALIIASPLELPPSSQIAEIREPWMLVTIVAPTRSLGALLTLIRARRGTERERTFPGSDQLLLRVELPLASLLQGFYDTLKGVSSGYASMSYEFLEDRPAKVRRLDILIAEVPVEALAMMAYDDELSAVARRVVERLRELLPRQLFEVKIQAAVGGKIIAAERLSPMRKDVTAKLYGGDVTRKRKLLEKQKKGKERLKSTGRVTVPPDVYAAMLQRP